MKLWHKMMIGLVLGVIAGLVLGDKALYLKPIGTLFLSLLNMLVIPLVFSSLTVGVTSIKDVRKLGRVGFKTLFLYILTTMIAIVIGLALATWIKPGVGISLVATQASEVSYEKVSPIEMILSLVPQNPIGALAQGHILQVIVFALLFGVGINLAGEKAKKVVSFLESLSEIMYALTRFVMRLSPYGIFAIMAWVTGNFGLKILLPLFKLITAHYVACILHMFFIFGGLLYFVAKVKPWPFFKGMRDAIVLAASTSSSSATLPTSLHCTQANLGVSKNIASFVLPLGATINMNGTAIFQAIAAIFIAQAFGITLTLSSMALIVVTATFAAIGCAGIPGGGLITLSIVLNAVGLPLEGIAIVASIDRIRDIICTVVNILGDSAVAVYVAKSEGELDEKCYNNPELVIYKPTGAQDGE